MTGAEHREQMVALEKSFGILCRASRSCAAARWALLMFSPSGNLNFFACRHELNTISPDHWSLLITNAAFRIISFLLDHDVPPFPATLSCITSFAFFLTPTGFLNTDHLLQNTNFVS
jgi:hypothetical protein